MNVPLKLGLYGAGLIAVFFASFTLASFVVPADAADDWNAPARHSDTSHGSTP